MTTPDPDKVEFYLPIVFWVYILQTLDKKIEAISLTHGYGRVKVEFVIQQTGVSQVIFSDEIAVRNVPGQPTPKAKV